MNVYCNGLLLVCRADIGTHSPQKLELPLHLVLLPWRYDGNIFWNKFIETHLVLCDMEWSPYPFIQPKCDHPKIDSALSVPIHYWDSAVLSYCIPRNTYQSVNSAFVCIWLEVESMNISHSHNLAVIGAMLATSHPWQHVFSMFKSMMLLFTHGIESNQVTSI